MQLSDLKPRIKSIHCRRILNSHVEFTNEFILELESGLTGMGASPKGETTSIYEDRTITVDPKGIIEKIKEDQLMNGPLDQETFDEYLQNKIDIFGRNNSYALSLAFYNASNQSESQHWHKKMDKDTIFPNICLNILNGGNYAYTNPVLSDFPEFLLVSKSNNLMEIINEHNEIQKKVRSGLRDKDKILVNDNLVNKFKVNDNRACIEFLLDILEDLKLMDKYDLMIDASGGDLWTEEGYRFLLTDNSLKTGNELCSYWVDLINNYNIRFLEDPFHERDFESWEKLTNTQRQCSIVGDNFYSSNYLRIEEGAVKGYTNGTVIKPNQAGSVSATMQAIKTAERAGQMVITSHRSISTESTFLSEITVIFKVKHIKIGPLYTDFSAIVRLNKLIRLAGGEYE